VTYVDASAILRVLFGEPGPTVPLGAGAEVVSSEIVEVEAFRAVDRARLLGELDDREVATKRKELTDLIARMDLLRVDRSVIDRAKLSFGVNLRTLDAIHVATAELVGGESDSPVEFWTHDDRQRLAALSRGLTVRG
jgi:uncharacterized protein